MIKQARTFRSFFLALIGGQEVGRADACPQEEMSEMNGPEAALQDRGGRHEREHPGRDMSQQDVNDRGVMGAETGGGGTEGRVGDARGRDPEGWCPALHRVGPVRAGTEHAEGRVGTPLSLSLSRVVRRG